MHANKCFFSSAQLCLLLGPIHFLLQSLWSTWLSKCADVGVRQLNKLPPLFDVSPLAQGIVSLSESGTAVEPIVFAQIENLSQTVS